MSLVSPQITPEHQRQLQAAKERRARLYPSQPVVNVYRTIIKAEQKSKELQALPLWMQKPTFFAYHVLAWKAQANPLSMIKFMAIENGVTLAELRNKANMSRKFCGLRAIISLALIDSFGLSLPAVAELFGYDRTAPHSWVENYCKAIGRPSPNPRKPRRTLSPEEIVDAKARYMSGTPLFQIASDFGIGMIGFQRQANVTGWIRQKAELDYQATINEAVREQIDAKLLLNHKTWSISKALKIPHGMVLRYVNGKSKQ